MAANSRAVGGLLTFSQNDAFTLKAPPSPQRGHDQDQDELYKCLEDAKGRCGEKSPIANEDYDSALRFLRGIGLIVDKGDTPTSLLARYIISYLVGNQEAHYNFCIDIPDLTQYNSIKTGATTTTTPTTASIGKVTSTHAPPRKINKSSIIQPYGKSAIVSRRHPIAVDPSPLLRPSSTTIQTSRLTVDIPRKSSLAFRTISEQLRTRLVVFSTRKRTKVYDSPDGAKPYTTTIALLHVKSSLEGLGQYMALKAVPLPPRSTDHKSSEQDIPSTTDQSAPSFPGQSDPSSSGQGGHTISHHTEPQSPSQDEYVCMDATQSNCPPDSTPVYNIATFRSSRRKDKRPTKEESERLKSTIQPDGAYKVFQHTCWNYLRDVIETKVRSILFPKSEQGNDSCKKGKKGKKAKGKKGPDIEKQQRELRKKLTTGTKMPDGLLKQTVFAIQNYYQNPQLTTRHVQLALNPNKTDLLRRFQTEADMGFDGMWDIAMQDARDELSGSTGESLVTGGTTEDDLRVCSTTLAHILRPEFTEEDVKSVEKAMSQKRDQLSDYTEEIYIIALKSTILIASGVLHDEARVFDVQKVLPEGFAVRDTKMEDDPSLLEVKAGVITGELQERFQDLKKYGKNKPDDICLLDQDHLSYMSSRLLGVKSKAYQAIHPPKSKKAKSTESNVDPSGHLGWHKILTAIESSLELDQTTSAGNYAMKRKRKTNDEDEDTDQSFNEIDSHMSIDDNYNNDDVASESSNVDYEDHESGLHDIEIGWKSTASDDGQPGSSFMDVEYDRSTLGGESDGSGGSDDGDDGSTPTAKGDIKSRPLIPKSLGQTCTEMVREVAKNISNLWKGRLYVKLLDYTLRILLRLHLAPRREQANYDRCRTAVAKKAADATEATGKIHSMRFKTWLSKMTDLFNQLDKALEITDISRMNQEITIILDLIIQHNLQKPTKQERFPDLEKLDVRAAKSHSEGTKSDDSGDVDDGDSEDSDDEDFQEESDVTPGKEPSRRHLNALQSLARRVLQDPDPMLDVAVTANTIRSYAYDKAKFSDREYDVAAMIVRNLRPHVAKNQAVPAGETGSRDPPHFVMLLAPFAVIANTILTATGYRKFTSRLSPMPSATSTHPLPLNAAALYEVLASSGEQQFDVLEPGVSGRTITSAQQARDIEGGKAMFAAFFDLEAIDRICINHGLRFANKITFVDKLTMRIMGSVIPSDPTNPSRHPTGSFYNSKRKAKSRNPAGIKWASELANRGLTKQDAEDQAAIWSEKLTVLEPNVKVLKSQLSTLERQRSTALGVHRGRDNDDKKNTYKVVKDIREQVDKCRRELDPEETDLRLARRSNYYWNKLTTTTPAENPSAPEGVTITSRPTVERPATQDFVEATCIQKLASSVPGSQHIETFAGTDRGLKMMHLTVPQSRQELDAHINRYSALYNDWETVINHEDNDLDSNNNGNTQSVQTLANTPTTPQQRRLDLEKIKKPKSNTISAKQIQETSFSRSTAKKRERRLKKSNNQHIRHIHKELADNSLERACSLEDVEKAQEYRREVRDQLRSFELSNARIKEQHIQELRTNRVWALYSARERKRVQQHAQKPILSPLQATQTTETTKATETTEAIETTEATGVTEATKATGVTKATKATGVTKATKATATVRVTDGWCNGECGIHHLPEMTDQGLSYEGVTCPKTRQKVIPVMLVGTGGLCVGSRMGGHLKLGGGRITDQHMQNCPVLMTNEMRTSQVCIFCYHQLRLARAHRLVDGSIKTVRVHGAVECVNRDCEAVQCGYTIRGRDDNAAVAIAIAGYSNLTSRDTLKTGERRTLPSFEPRLRPQIATPNPSASDTTGIYNNSEGISDRPSLASTRCPQGPRL